MTSRERIVVRVTTDGEISAETKGIKGPKCLDSIQLLENLLEAVATNSAFTVEYTQASEANTIEVDDELRQR